MKNMNLPGFTAEASLYRSIEHYQMVATLKGGSLSLTPVLPQLTDAWLFDNNRPSWANDAARGEALGAEDPAGWGVPSWIGDVGERRCQARCRKITNPQQRAECLENC